MSTSVTSDSLFAKIGRQAVIIDEMTMQIRQLEAQKANLSKVIEDMTADGDGADDGDGPGGNGDDQSVAPRLADALTE